MKAALVLLWTTTLVGAGAVGCRRSTDAAGCEQVTLASFEQALQTRDELERAYVVSSFLRGLDAAQLPGVLDAIREHDSGITREEVRLLMLAWSRFDPQGATAWAREWPTPWSRTLVEEAMYAWGFRDARSALPQLDATPDEATRMRLRNALLEGWIHGPDRAGASAYVAAIDDPKQRGRLTFLLSAETAVEGPDALVAWVEAVPVDAPHDFKRGAFYQATAMIAHQDPQRAARWWEGRRAEPFSRDALTVIARRWAQYHDPLRLFAWLRALPANPERPDEVSAAIGAGFQTWLREHRDAAVAWLESQPPARDLDPAFAMLVRVRAQEAPAEAAEWTARIQDEGQRRQSRILVGRAWLHRDEAAARAWLAQLPDEEREAIEQRPPAPAGRAAVRRATPGRGPMAVQP